MSRTTRWAATALILLSAAAVQAAPLSGRAPRPAGLFDAAREWLASFLIPESPEAGTRPDLEEKEGGMMDPNGDPPHENPEGATDPDPHG